MRILIPLFALSFAAPAVAGGGHDHAAMAMPEADHMATAVTHFTAIGDALANDSTTGLAEHAAALKKMMSMSDGDHHGGDMTATHAKMNTALDSLGATNVSITDARDAYKDLSASFIPMAQKQYKKAGSDPSWVVMSCPMANAEWIQKSGATANPYYGTEMAGCGSKVSDLGAAAAPTDDHAHSH